MLVSSIPLSARLKCSKPPLVGCDADASRVESCEKATKLTQLLWPLSVLRQAPLLASHLRAWLTRAGYSAASTGESALDLTQLSQLLRQRGWIVPAYTLPPNAEHITVMRMVVKENFSRDMVDMLAQDVVKAMHALARVHPSLHPGRPRLRPGC